MVYLWGCGYRLRARRYKTPVGEIDVIASRGRVLAFIEVKARPSIDEGLYAVTPAQAARIRRAAEMYLAAHPDCAGQDARFDLMVLRPWRWPRHIKNAW